MLWLIYFYRSEYALQEYTEIKTVSTPLTTIHYHGTLTLSFMNIHARLQPP